MGKLKVKDHSNGKDIGGYNIKNDLSDIDCCAMGSIDLALDRDEWRSLLNMVINSRVP
jgi:hypothetical protein